MVSSKDKNRSTIGVIVTAFVVIMIVTFVAHFRSLVKEELDTPRAGVERLYTAAHWLVATTPNKELYIWDWRNISDKPERITLTASNIVWLPEKKVVWVPQNRSGKVLISSLEEDEIPESSDLGDNWECAGISISGNGKYMAVTLVGRAENTSQTGLQERFGVATVSPDGKFSNIATKPSTKEHLAICEAAVSNNGEKVALVGSENGTGWISVADMVQGRFLWEKRPQQCSELSRVVFSPDGTTVYAGGAAIYLYRFDLTNGKLLDKWTSPETVTAKVQNLRISSLAVSPNGRFVATAWEPLDAINVWRVDTGKPVQNLYSKYTAFVGMAFSPESERLATAGLSTRDKIKIWRITGPN